MYNKIEDIGFHGDVLQIVLSPKKDISKMLSKRFDLVSDSLFITKGLNLEGLNVKKFMEENMTPELIVDIKSYMERV